MLLSLIVVVVINDVVPGISKLVFFCKFMDLVIGWVYKHNIIRTSH